MNYDNNFGIKTEIYDKINAEKRKASLDNNNEYNEALEEQRTNRIRIKKNQIKRKKQKRKEFAKRIAFTVIIAATLFGGTKIGTHIEDKKIAKNVIEMEVDDVVDGLKNADSREEKRDIVNSFVKKNMETGSFQGDLYARGHAEGYTIWKIQTFGEFESTGELEAITDEVLDILGYDSLDLLAQRNGFWDTYTDGKTSPGSYYNIIGKSQEYYKTELENEIDILKGATK